MNLMQHYRLRHNLKCIWPMNEGVLFFEQEGRPVAIALTSSFTKAVTVCDGCVKNADSITLELYRLYEYPHCIQRVTHTHMPPDSDLWEYVKNHVPGGENFTPYVCKSERDVEGWLWNFFVSTNVMYERRGWQRFKRNNDICWIDEAFWCIHNHPELYKEYYNKIYSLCMVNRKYILVG